MTLPTFLICGAHKAGTTALYKFLDQHPGVLMSEPKETDFFGRHYNRGWEWFASHFEGYEGQDAVGEASSMTMASEEAPERIAERLPNVKLIFLLRNPIRRAYSHYYYHLYTGKATTPASFGEVIRDQNSEFRDEIIRLGRYDRQIPRFDDYFNRDQMTIILQEDLQSETTSVVENVYRFIGVDPDFDPATDTYNATKHPTSPGLFYWARRAWQPLEAVGQAIAPVAVDVLREKARDLFTNRDRPGMEPEARTYLRDVYKDTISWTEQRLECDLSHWR
ncbi:hypothetical protein BSZ35_11090 [Salinibacter sp. 10B]|uniref:sulfotransferase domain-containing protein n=1 Tax=Salinibacter sp. 10B TaxID=1923971 RepID=UPI000D2DBE31|nr:sulfotransferase domain-containing protein [Salinibacter sp. 10B]PQJ35066.1 hypothetical protein BSZ35_11090 [Salinibacter sp. 10B]